MQCIGGGDVLRGISRCYFNSQPKKLLKIFSEGNEPCQKQIKAIKIYTVSHFVLL